MLEKVPATNRKHAVVIVLQATTKINLSQLFTEYASGLNHIGAIPLSLHNARRVIKTLHDAGGHTHIGVETTDDQIVILTLSISGRCGHEEFVGVHGERQMVVVVEEDGGRNARFEVGGDEVALSGFGVTHFRTHIGHTNPPIHAAIPRTKLDIVVGMKDPYVNRDRTSGAAVRPQNIGASRQVRMDVARGETAAELVSELL